MRTGDAPNSQPRKRPLQSSAAASPAVSGPQPASGSKPLGRGGMGLGLGGLPLLLEEGEEGEEGEEAEEGPTPQRPRRESELGGCGAGGSMGFMCAQGWAVWSAGCRGTQTVCVWGSTGLARHKGLGLETGVGVR